MSDRPIIFSAPMVRALLDGRKTQTRRLAERWMEGPKGCKWVPSSWQRVQPGDRLWVREAWRWGNWPGSVLYAADNIAAAATWKSPIHMPRVCSRITLTVTGVRLQRLQEISEADARDEGCWSETAILETALLESVLELAVHPSMVFRRLWDKLHGPGAWDANPAVAALTFTVGGGNIDDV